MAQHELVILREIHAGKRAVIDRAFDSWAALRSFSFCIDCYRTHFSGGRKMIKITVKQIIAGAVLSAALIGIGTGKRK